MWRIAGRVILILLVLVFVLLVLFGYFEIIDALGGYSVVTNYGRPVTMRALQQWLIQQQFWSGLIVVVVGVCGLISIWAWWRWRVARPKEVRDDK
jgi:hypothetical protein